MTVFPTFETTTLALQLHPLCLVEFLPSIIRSQGDFGRIRCGNCIPLATRQEIWASASYSSRPNCRDSFSGCSRIASGRRSSEKPRTNSSARGESSTMLETHSISWNFLEFPVSYCLELWHPFHAKTRTLKRKSSNENSRPAWKCSNKLMFPNLFTNTQQCLRRSSLKPVRLFQPKDKNV